jgi:hypothetical protein
MNIRFGAKHALFIRTSGEKLHPKIQPSSPYLGLKWGGELKNAENVLIFEYFSRIDMY